MKVYGWTGRRNPREFQAHFPDAPSWNIQTREFVAAPSKAAVYRITGGRPSEHFNITETGNKRELEIATANPGVVYWRPLDAYKADPVPS